MPPLVDTPPTSRSEPSQLFAWSAVVAGALPWLVLPIAGTLLQLTDRRVGADDGLLFLAFAAAAAFGVFRIGRHAVAPVEREAAVVVVVIEKKRKGRRKQYEGRTRYGACKVQLRSESGTRTLITDELVLRKARRGSSGIAWRRGRYLLDWERADA